MKNIAKTKLSYMVKIPLIKDESQLLFAEAKKHIPFNIKRIYVISKVDVGSIRGLHAHRNLKQVLFCIQDSIKFVLDNGITSEEIILDKPDQGIFIDKWMWREMREFSSDTVLLVFASEYFSEKDYIRDYGQFLKEINNRQNNFILSLVKSVKNVFDTRIFNQAHFNISKKNL